MVPVIHPDLLFPAEPLLFALKPLALRSSGAFIGDSVHGAGLGTYGPALSLWLPSVFR